MSNEQELVEKVARELSACEARNGAALWEKLSKFSQDFLREQARTVIPLISRQAKEEMLHEQWDFLARGNAPEKIRGWFRKFAHEHDLTIPNEETKYSHG